MEPAPDFPTELQWLQATSRLHWPVLRGHVVAVLFWRMGCRHSRNALSDLGALQRSLAGQPFALIAVHTPHREAERDPDRVRAFLQLHGLPCAIALDPDRLAWRTFAATGWPFLVLVDDAGQVRFRGRGEPNATALAAAVSALLPSAPAAQPFVPAILPRPRAPSGLCFPGRLCAGAGRIWLSDTGHHRVLEIDEQTLAVVRAFGNGEAGFTDGGPDAARFCRPRGLCLAGGNILVADAGNHALRSIDPKLGNVCTVCGDGDRSPDRYGGGFGTMQGLCEPVDLGDDGTSLRVCQSGQNQLWTFDPGTQSASVWLGTGSEALRDGGEDACFSQPEGLWADREAGELWVADSGNGALRSVDGHAAVRTRVQGLGRPAAIAGHRGDLIVADPWQRAVLRVARADGSVQRLVGAEHGLVAPEGLLVREDELLIADAGAHRLLALDLSAAATTLREVNLRDVPLPYEAPLYESVDFAEVSVCALTEIVLWLRPPPVIAQRWPDGSRLAWFASLDSETLPAEPRNDAQVTKGLVRIDGVAIGPPGVHVLRLELRGPLLPDGTTAPVSLRCTLPVVAAGDGALEVRVEPARART